MRWPFKNKHTSQVDIEESKRMLDQAVSRQPRTRRVAIGVERAISQNNFTADIETIMKGPKR